MAMKDESQTAAVERIRTPHEALNFASLVAASRLN